MTGPSVICERWFDCRLKGCHHRKVHEHMGSICESECRELLNQGAGPLMKAFVPAVPNKTQSEASMHKIAILLLSVGISVLTGCKSQEQREYDADMERERFLQHRIDIAKEALEDTVYVLDERTGRCFGFGWAGMDNVGPFVFEVECTEEIQ